MADMISAESMGSPTDTASSFPRTFSFLGRALFTVEGVGKRLDPSSASWRWRPFRQRSRAAQGATTPRQVVVSESVDYLEMLARIADHDRALDRSTAAKRDRFPHRGLSPPINRIDIVSNRISFSVIIGALIVAVPHHPGPNASLSLRSPLLGS